MRNAMTQKTLCVVLSAAIVLAMPGCETMSDTKVGTGLGAVVGGIIGYQFGKEEGAVLGAVLGGVAGSQIQQHWRKAKAREAERRQVKTQEQVNQEWQMEHVNQPLPVQPAIEIEPAGTMIVPTVKVLKEGQPVTCTINYETVGPETSNLSVCRRDTLAYKDVGEPKFAPVTSLYDQCDLEGRGQNTHATTFTIPEGVQHGVYMVASYIEVKQGGQVIANDYHDFYFAVGDEFAEDVPASGSTSRQASRAPISTVPPGEGRYHVVETGDTLGEIATRYGTTVGAIMSANGMTNANRISVGQSLRIP